MQKISLPKFNCLKCKHQWYPRTPNKPAVCPYCKSPRYDWEISKTEEYKPYGRKSKVEFNYKPL